MLKTLAVLAFASAAATTLSGCAGGGFAFAPTAGRPYEAQPGVARSEFECMTDDGYGRSRPCNAQD
jgi:hypothetical protein